jgi:hypothetical protein
MVSGFSVLAIIELTPRIGAQLVLYTTCALYLWNQRKTRKQSVFLLAYTTLLLVIETIFMVVQANSVQSMYIDNRNYPGGPWKYFLDTQNLPINVIFIATLFALTFLSDLLVVSVPGPCYITSINHTRIDCTSYGAAG